MKINSNTDSWLSIKQASDINYSSFELEASVNICHSIFQGKNIDIHFLNLKQFVGHFEKLILDRSISPILNGTYDSFLEFKGTNNIITLSFNIGSSFCGLEIFDYSLIGAFEIPQEQLNSLLEDFIHLEKLQ